MHLIVTHELMYHSSSDTRNYKQWRQGHQKWLIVNSENQFQISDSQKCFKVHIHLYCVNKTQCKAKSNTKSFYANFTNYKVRLFYINNTENQIKVKIKLSYINKIKHKLFSNIIKSTKFPSVYKYKIIYCALPSPIIVHRTKNSVVLLSIILYI